jgi:NAD(P)-dependent dehydrogenase (short-subunit alcohol dehydrogenase family)
VPAGDTFSLTITDPDGQPVLTAESVLLSPAQDAVAAKHESLFEVAWTQLPGGAAEAGRWVAVGDVGLPGVETYPDLAAIGDVPDVVLTSVAPSLDVVSGAYEATHRMLELAQAWLADNRFAESRLVVVTHNADLVGAAVQGLIRSAQSEHPGRFLLVEVDDVGGLEASLPEALACGESEVAIRSGAVFVPRLARVPRVETQSWQAGGTVLITGGTGDLGKLTARHLVTEHGARRLVLTSRSGLEAPGAAGLQAELAGLGAEVVIAACDVADRDDLAALLADISADRPLRTVVHCASVIDDGVIESLTPKRIDVTLRPKVDAAWHLHELTQHMDLEAFVLFSSMAGTLGAPGQANYAAGNVFVDALAQYRRSKGLVALSVAWGMWAGRAAITHGDLAEKNISGNIPLTEERGLALLDAAWTASQPVVVAAELDMKVLRAASDVLPTLLRGLVRAPARRTAGTATSGGTSLVDQLAGVPVEEQERVVLDLVRTHAAAVLGHDSAGAVDPHHRFLEIGFDSLGAVKLRNRLGVVTGLRFPATLIFDHPTAAELARHVLDELLPQDAEAAVLVLEELHKLDGSISMLAPGNATRQRIAQLLVSLSSKWGV